MTKDELKEHAKLLGLKVRENFMDDWIENLTILGLGVFIGWMVFKLL